MKRVLAASFGLALLFAGANVLAAEATGVIESIDATALTLTLADGQTFKLAPEVSVEGLAPGANVTITYEAAADGTMTASAVAPAG